MVWWLSFHCHGPGFDPWSGNGDPTDHVVQEKKKDRERKKGLLCRNHTLCDLGGGEVSDWQICLKWLCCTDKFSVNLCLFQNLNL